MVDLSSIFVNGERRNLSCFIRRAPAKHLVFRGISFKENDGHSWRMSPVSPGASFKSFLSWNDDKATAAVTEYLHKNPSRIDRKRFFPQRRFKLSLINAFILCFIFLKFRNSFCLILPLVPLSSIEYFILFPMRRVRGSLCLPLISFLYSTSQRILKLQ